MPLNKFVRRSFLGRLLGMAAAPTVIKALPPTPPPTLTTRVLPAQPPITITHYSGGTVCAILQRPTAPRPRE